MAITISFGIKEYVTLLNPHNSILAYSYDVSSCSTAKESKKPIISQSLTAIELIIGIFT